MLTPRHVGGQGIAVDKARVAAILNIDFRSTDNCGDYTFANVIDPTIELRRVAIALHALHTTP